MTNIQETGIVQAEFEGKSGKADCTQGGVEAGKVEGIDRIAASGYAIRVS